MLLDTHAWVWLLEGDARLGARAVSSIEAAARTGAVWVSAISPWEVGMLVAKQRLVFTHDVLDWVQEALAQAALRLAPLTPDIAVGSTRLPGEIHGDPADRLLVATARKLGVALVTAGEALLTYGRAGHVHTIDARE
ncbi:type II toxin-antitoxin system VapC family toxin [Thiomonas sp. X19]|uniref:type II toxin-antitoxin system VapC family toxin n=1 Tax=Thiomonas sp. X19 TaxID=1050370 RepID=UPI001E5F3E59|nr:type II toxin-antitoxin system VapC family toxin [Thiomonas sp. X19]